MSLTLKSKKRLLVVALMAIYAATATAQDLQRFPPIDGPSVPHFEPYVVENRLPQGVSQPMASPKQVRDYLDSRSSQLTSPALVVPIQTENLPGPISANNASEPTMRLAQAPQAQAANVSKLQQQIDIQQEQLGLLNSMIETSVAEINRLSEQLATVPSSSEESIAELQARQRQAAFRDNEVARRIDSLTESLDTHVRQTQVPSTAKEWFLPTRFNESPIVHYGQFAFTYADFEDADGNFASPVYFPRFLMLLNEQLVLDINPLIKSDEISIIAAQVDWHVHDNLSLSAGRFYAPLGFFGERLQTGWVWKSVDIPLLFNQVYPTPFSVNGVMARGAYYPGAAPVKLEYAAFMGNGMSLELENGDEKDFADLRASRNVFDDVNNEKAFGGRLGVSFPKLGFIMGASGMVNGAYDAEEEHDLSLYGFDVSLHRGNWDFRYEYVHVDQQSPFGEINREGQYAQAAWRNYKSPHPILHRLEYLIRYDVVDFEGIDLGATGLAFGGRVNIPIDRNRWLAQINFYPSPSLILKVGYELLDERGNSELDDNGFVTQILWGF